MLNNAETAILLLDFTKIWRFVCVIVLHSGDAAYSMDLKDNVGSHVECRRCHMRLFQTN